jgi:Cdc6-like AAA superfamily ATPase
VELSVKQVDYAKYNLKNNPFPYVGVPNEKILVYTNRKKELKQISEAIKGTLKGSSSHLILVGNYGNGKTSTLKYIGNQISTQVPQSQTIYLSYPGDSFLELYGNMIYQIGLPMLEDYIWRFLEISNEIDDLKQKVDTGEVLFPEIIEIGKRKLFDLVNYNDFATALLHIVLSDTRFVAWKYICGESVLHDQRKELDIVSVIDNDEKALRAFLSLKILLNYVNKTRIFLLIDEMESIETLHIFKKQKMLNSLRRVMDLNPTGLCMIMACTPEAWNGIISDYHAFSERIFRNVILTPLNEEMLRQLIVDYLAIHRIDPDLNGSSIHPFSAEALSDIQLAAQGNVRRLLMICNRIIEFGLENEYNEITSEVVKELFPEIFEMFQ